MPGLMTVGFTYCCRELRSKGGYHRSHSGPNTMTLDLPSFRFRKFRANQASMSLRHSNRGARELFLFIFMKYFLFFSFKRQVDLRDFQKKTICDAMFFKDQSKGDKIKWKVWKLWQGKIKSNKTGMWSEYTPSHTWILTVDKPYDKTRSNVCPGSCVGSVTYCMKLKASIKSKKSFTSGLQGPQTCTSKSPIIKILSEFVMIPAKNSETSLIKSHSKLINS